jgi:hypothetical protein
VGLLRVAGDDGACQDQVACEFERVDEQSHQLLPSHTFLLMAEEYAVLEERSNSLRKELKAWEKSFADTNSGRKAERDDIKANLDIGM